LTGGTRAAEELAEQALSAYRAADYEQALKSFSAARDSYKVDGNPRRAAEMSNNLAVCLLELDRPDEALSCVQDTPTIFHNEGDLLLKAQALGNRAMAKEALGQGTEAEADYRAAADLFRELGHNEGLQYTMQALSKLQLKEGRTMEALNAMQSVLDSKEKLSLRDRFLSWLFKFPLRFLGR
jgi:tetratricopeptide (TPR) repeat protein